MNWFLGKRLFSVHNRGRVPGTNMDASNSGFVVCVCNSRVELDGYCELHFSRKVISGTQYSVKITGVKNLRIN